jgi:hypothetical protein
VCRRDGYPERESRIRRLGAAAYCEPRLTRAIGRLATTVTGVQAGDGKMSS